MSTMDEKRGKERENKKNKLKIKKFTSWKSMIILIIIARRTVAATNTSILAKILRPVGK